MSEAYDGIRSLSFVAVASLLGIDASVFKRRKNGELYGPCPFHKPKANKTSFSYAPDGKFHCFSCEVKGRGAIDLTMRLLKIGFKEACERLGSLPATQAQETRPEAISEALDTLPKPFTGSYAKFKVECEWLDKRVPKEVQERYGVFCYNNPARKSAYSGKVMLPVKGADGVLYGYLARSIEGEPKYIFPKGLPKSLFLFGAYEVAERQKFVYLVESPFCVMKFASLGLPAVSPFGWSVSEDQANILAGIAKGVIYLPDADKHEEAKSFLPILASRLWVKYPSQPEGIEDPEDLSLEQIQAL